MLLAMPHLVGLVLGATLDDFDPAPKNGSGEKLGVPDLILRQRDEQSFNLLGDWPSLSSDTVLNTREGMTVRTRLLAVEGILY